MSVQQEMPIPQDDSNHESDEMTESTNEERNLQDQDCFDPRISCDASEQYIIEAMRAILRPDRAPACLYERLKLTLDACCGQVSAEHTVIRHTVIRKENVTHPDELTATKNAHTDPKNTTETSQQ